MQVLVRQWQEASDKRAVFLDCYLRMTRGMLTAIEAGEFHDPVWVSALLIRFADYYFDALDAYERQSPATPAVWKLVHDATGRERTMILQDLLLGINAHINYDLVLTLVDMMDAEWSQLSDTHRQQRYADHSHVNAVIGRTIDAVQDQVVEHYAPGLNVIDLVLGPLDEWVMSRMIAHWRDEVWKNAVVLIETPDTAERERLRRGVEEHTLGRADVIELEDLGAVMSRLV